METLHSGPTPPPGGIVFVSALAVIDAYGALAARLAAAPASAAASDAIEEFEDLMRQFRAGRGDAAADELLARIERIGFALGA